MSLQTGTLTVCSIECVLTTSAVCNGFTYDDVAKKCTLGLFNAAATPANVSTVVIYKAI